ncbi:MAG TPA: hypothetical protein VFN19_06550 [Candidatus Nanopelagicales bacterium]|nr:hypothetical protein [Candidatus Nanopelagicales bacterium]
MGCLLCARRQVDPVRGPSPWQRGVVVPAEGGPRQVLVCPDCRQDPRWVEVLARCERCGSTSLAVRLGQVSCRQCGPTTAQAGPAEVPVADGEAPLRLGADVAAAIDRVLGRVSP